MKSVLVKELENKSHLPFDLFAKNGQLIFSKGEQITPGKLLQLRFIDLYRSDEEVAEPPEPRKQKLPEKKKTPIKTIYGVKTDRKPSSERLRDFNYESILSIESQLLIKESFHSIVDDVAQGILPDSEEYIAARETIVTQVLSSVDNLKHLNQIRLFDEYDYSHGMNVSLLSVTLGYKMGLSGYLLRPLALGALLHDIGKVRIPKQILYKKGALSFKEYEIVKLHTTLGYKIIKHELNLPEEIARLALEHQEKFDGSGYPKGLSGEDIDQLSQIVTVCDVYDALVSTKVYSNPKPSQDALKIMLNYGSKWFNPSILYKFIHMTTFNE